MLKSKHKHLWPQDKKSILNIVGLKIQKQIFAKLPNFRELAFLRQFLTVASLGGFSLSLLPSLQEEHGPRWGAQPASPIPSASLDHPSKLHNCQLTQGSRRKARWEKHVPLGMLMAQSWFTLWPFPLDSVCTHSLEHSMEQKLCMSDAWSACPMGNHNLMGRVISQWYRCHRLLFLYQVQTKTTQTRNLKSPKNTFWNWTLQFEIFS